MGEEIKVDLQHDDADESKNGETLNEDSNENQTKASNEKDNMENEQVTGDSEIITRLKTKAETMKEMDKEDIINEYKELVEEVDEMVRANDELKKFAKEKEAESVDYLDRYRRTLADIENIRKRTAVEKQDSLKYANENIIKDLLTLLDDFERAIEAAKSHMNEESSVFIQGIEMIEKQFIELLFKKYGVEKFGEPGEEFDPNKHQGVMMEHGDYKHETVIEVFRKGYMLHERVLRNAQVKIGKPEE